MIPPNAGAEGIVDVDWIATHLGDPSVRIVEVDVSRAVYDEGHIPGAVLWNAYTDLRDVDYRPVGLAELEQLLSRSGISPRTTVVVYGYSAPLGFWLLKAHGHVDVRILMGGHDQWTRAGNEWSTDAPKPATGAHPSRGPIRSPAGFRSGSTSSRSSNRRARPPSPPHPSDRERRRSWQC